MNTFEIIMENGAFALLEQLLHFPYFVFKYIVFQRCQKQYYGVKSFGASAPFSIFFFKYIVFQRCQKALLWSKGLKNP